MTKKELQDLYLSYLKDEGYKGEIDEEGDITFKYEGGLYCIFLDPDDEEYFRMIFPCFWKLETDDEKVGALLAANSVNSQYKCGKIVLVGENENVTADISSFQKDVNGFKNFFPRMLSILQGMVDDFENEMNDTD